jgi:hypothetical protein
MKNEPSRRASLPHLGSAASDPRPTTDQRPASRVDKSSVMEQARKPESGSAMRRIAAGLGAVSALFVALASLAAAPADAAAKTPFEAHGVFASCGQGESRTTIYMTFLSLRSERGFKDVKALLRHADEIRPRKTKLRVPGQNRARKLRSLGASLPDFLFIDYLETKSKPAAAARKRSQLSWRSERAGKRVATSLRFNRLGEGFCEPGKQKGAKDRMLREAAIAAKGGADSTPPEPETNGGSARDAAKRRSEGFPCPAGTYYGRADDGTELSLSYDGLTKASQIEARAEANGLSYEVGLPDATVSGPWFGWFVTGLPASQTELGYSPEAVMHGQCSGDDRFTVTIRDRAGERRATLSRVVLEPGLYEGRVWDAFWGRSRTNLTIRFRIYPKDRRCWEGSGLVCELDDVEFDGKLPGPIEGSKDYVWIAFRDDNSPWLAADNCRLGFTATRGDRLHRGGESLQASASCEPGNRVAGEMSTPYSVFYAVSLDLGWEARRVGD